MQNGRSSAYADFFDIDWEPLKPELRNKVLVPILGKPYGEDLEEGNIQDSFRGRPFCSASTSTRLTRRSADDSVDLCLVADLARPGAAMPILQLAELMSLIHRFRQASGQLSSQTRIRFAAASSEMPPLLDQLRRLASESAVASGGNRRGLRLLNGTPGDSHSFDRLHELLEAQVYRFAFWRVSGEEINYRRFFDINDLVGLRMENPRVFAETHKLIRTLLAEELISGLRIDHPDGLLNPTQYFMRLQRLFAASQCLGAQPEPPLAARRYRVGSAQRLSPARLDEPEGAALFAGREDSGAGRRLARLLAGGRLGRATTSPTW